jgi:hypothetical protein
MKLESVKDTEFREYGQVVEGYDFSGFLKTLKEKTPRPADSVVYVPSEPVLEALSVFQDIKNNYYGGMPIQIGYCNGHNTKLNGLEYHRDSEINITVGDVILLLAKQSDISIADWSIPSSKVRAFFVPAGTAVELYATTLHYTPASADETGFQVSVVLPKGTNEAKPNIKIKNGEDKLLFGANKWLLVHSEAKTEITGGAHIGITGENHNVQKLWKS